MLEDRRHDEDQADFEQAKYQEEKRGSDQAEFNEGRAAFVAGITPDLGFQPPGDTGLQAAGHRYSPITLDNRK
jgi:hypothetical protein